MNDSNNVAGAYDSKEFMLAEYRTHQEELIRSEELGENRLNIFLTIVTALLGGSGIVLFYKGADSVWTSENNLLALLFANAVVLIFGLFTMVRMVRRNIVSDREKRATARIRRYFVERDFRISRYLTYGICDDEGRTLKWSEIKSPGSGGLVQTVMLLNALLSVIISYIMLMYQQYISHALANRRELWEIVLIIASGLLVWAIQFIYTKWEYERELEKAIKESRFPNIRKRKS